MQAASGSCETGSRLEEWPARCPGRREAPSPGLPRPHPSLASPKAVGSAPDPSTAGRPAPRPAPPPLGRLPPLPWAIGMAPPSLTDPPSVPRPLLPFLLRGATAVTLPAAPSPRPADCRLGAGAVRVH